MRVLGVETSCDDTSMAIVEDEKLVYMVRATSEEFHKAYGGVVPEIAARKQLEIFPFVLQELEKKSRISIKDIDGVSVTIGPGLVGSLLIGVEFAKTLSYSLSIPLIGVNHLEGHIYSIFFDQKIDFPFLSLIISGGHTILLIFENHLKYKLLGETQDDSAGEIIDKIGRKLGFDYPAGKTLDELALKGDPTKYKFSIPKFKDKEKRYSFSFSGLKTEVLNVINKNDFKVEDLISSMFYAIYESLMSKIKLAFEEFKINRVSVVGGVSASKFLRKFFSSNENFEFYFPSFEFSTDNGGMIALVGERYFLEGYFSDYNLDAVASLNLNSNPFIKKK